MKEITFTFLDKIFTLDLVNGILHGEDGEEKEKIVDVMETYKHQGYCGEDYESWVSVDITDPYRDIYQFAACMLVAAQFTLYPPELNDYLPEFYDNSWAKELEKLGLQVCF